MSLTHYRTIRRRERQKSRVLKLSPDCAVALVLQGIIGEEVSDTPCAYEEAIASVEKAIWNEAMNLEKREIMAKGIVELVNSP